MFSPLELTLRTFLPSPLRHSDFFLRYLSAVAATAVACVGTYLIWSFISPAVSLLFFVAVLFSSWYSGLKPGLLCCLLSTVACNYLFVHPGNLIALGGDDLLRLPVLMLAAVLVSTLTMAHTQSAEAAERIEKQLAVTLKSIGDAVITTDAKGSITGMNSVAQSLTGWTEVDARGKQLREIFQILDTKTRIAVDGVVNRVIRDNAVIALGTSVLLVSRDGSEVPINEIATPLRDNNGTLAGVVLVLRNVTHLSDEMPDNELLRQKIALLESVEAPMYAVDPQGRCLFISRAASRMLDYRSDEMIGKDFHEITHSRNGDGLVCKDEECKAHAAMLGEASPASINATMWRRPGDAVPVELSTAPIMIGDKVLGTVVTVIDLTERYRAQEALLTLKSIVNSVDVAVITHTLDGVITSWNQSAERIYGYSAEEVIGRSVSIIHPSGRPRELTPLFGRVARREKIDTFETVRNGKGGRQVNVSITVEPLQDPSGALAGVVQVARDITAQKIRDEAEVARNSNRRAKAVRADSSWIGNDAVLEEGVSEVSRHAAAQGIIWGEKPGSGVVMVGSSPAMQKLVAAVRRVAPTDSSVLITGATGTGKELVARAIHEQSTRAGGPFVDINCSAIPETLIEAELFGHQKGTFTGAHENRAGLFEAASGGTLFLDEIDALNLSAQAKLLRVLQERSVRRIGARTNIAVDARIISATNCDLRNAVNQDRFRADLFYRLRAFPLHLPELCEREDDVELLVIHFLERHAKRNKVGSRRFTPKAMEALRKYPWPGNVRELENAIDYAMAMGTGAELGVEDLPTEIVAVQAPKNSDDLKQVMQKYMTDGTPLAEIEKRYILSVLQQFGGNQAKAAAALGIDRSKLYRRLKQYGVMAVKFLQEEQDGLQLRTWDQDVVKSR